ncbi:hypothetical protein JCM15519_04750 [Fundidesulfovibrio butyratiphilus]
MAEQQVSTARAEGNREKAHQGALQAYDTITFLAKALRPAREEGVTFSGSELEGLAHSLSHCGDLLWPAIEVLGAQGKEVRHGQPL